MIIVSSPGNRARRKILKLTTLAFSSSAESPADSICTATLTSTGDITGSGLSAHLLEYLNLQAAGYGAEYECNFSSVTGNTADLTGAALDTWHALSSNRSYTLSATGIASKTVNGTMTVREIADVGNSVTAAMQMFAEIDTGL